MVNTTPTLTLTLTLHPHQNVSMVNTVLCSALAEAFNNFSAAIEKGQAPLAVAQANPPGHQPKPDPNPTHSL